jgi:hypothetical protein
MQVDNHIRLCSPQLNFIVVYKMKHVIVESKNVGLFKKVKILSVLLGISVDLFCKRD